MKQKKKVKEIPEVINKRFETAEGVCKKIYQGISKGAITFNGKDEIDNPEYTEKKWISNELDSGANVSLTYKLIKGKNDSGKTRKPSYKVILSHNNNNKIFRGVYARKIYLRLEDPKQIGSSKFDDKDSTFCENALDNI